MRPLDLILSKLAKVSAQSGGEYAACCPAHDDQRPSLSVREGDDGRILLHCFAGCPSDRIVEKLGLHMRDLYNRPDGGGDDSPSGGSNDRRRGLTLERYATEKGLDSEVLRALGVTEFVMNEAWTLRISYYDAHGSECGARLRFGLDGDARFKWTKGSKMVPYGAWRLGEARKAGRLTIVEGESDCHTLWQHGEPAIGVPGASTWKREWASHVEGILDLYVVQEPDEGGRVLLAKLSQSPFADRLRVLSLGEHKDVNSLFLAAGADFPRAWQEALDQAGPLSDRHPEEEKADEGALLAKAGYVLDDPDVLDRIGEALNLHFYAGDTRTPKLVYLVIASRFRVRPLNLILVAPSAAGKNMAIRCILPFFPSEAYYRLSAMSERALIYTDASFESRIIVLDEADSLSEDGAGASAVRSILTDSFMQYEVTVRCEATGGFTTQKIEKKGPTGMVTTSTKSLRTQLATRHLEDTIPDSSAQTKAIMIRQAERAAATTASAPDLADFHAQQQWLASYGTRDVVVPFAPVLATLIPAPGVRMRRDFPQLITAIETIAFLRQRLRVRTESGAIVATVDDYAVARDLLLAVFASAATEGVTEVIRETVAAVPDDGVKLTALAKVLGVAKSTVDWRVNQAIARGYLSKDEKSKTIKPAEPLPDRVPPLPTAEQVALAFERSSVTEVATPPPTLTSTPPSPGSAPGQRVDVGARRYPVADHLNTIWLCTECPSFHSDPAYAGNCPDCGDRSQNLDDLFEEFRIAPELRTAIWEGLEGPLPPSGDVRGVIFETFRGHPAPGGFGYRLLRHLERMWSEVMSFKERQKREAAAATV